MIKLLPVLLLMFCAATTAEQELVDPTRPYVSKHATVIQNEGLNLVDDTQVMVTAIFISDRNKHAIINGKNYSEGQVVLGNKIISIEQDRVVLSDDDGSKELFINSHNVKKDVTNDF